MSPIISIPSKPEPASIEQVQIPLGPTNGPAQGPAQGPIIDTPPVIAATEEDATGESLYISNRARIQNLTLPKVPNFDIPPSPTGSPPPGSTKKFSDFLKLKKQGHHFNRRMENSVILKDPGTFQRQMDFAGITEEEQYASTLPDEIAIPTKFPGWAYAEELRASQKKTLQAKEKAKKQDPRRAIDFISATKPRS
jgi:hypothetical protein